MQGVAPGAFPEQYELSEFEAAANCKLALTGRDKYDERLVQYKFLPEGDLPPLEDRLPEEPLVVVPYDAIGKYGGRISGASIGPEAGNSEWLSVRHVNLLRFADDLQTIVPNMAKAFEWNSDYTELTVTLRKGHKWSDGQPFTSEDIDFWWNDIVMNKDLYPDVPSYWVYGGEPMQSRQGHRNNTLRNLANRYASKFLARCHVDRRDGICAGVRNIAAGAVNLSHSDPYPRLGGRADTVTAGAAMPPRSPKRNPRRRWRHSSAPRRA